MGNGVLYRAGKGVAGKGLAALGGLNGRDGGLLDAGFLQSGALHDTATQSPRQLVNTDGVLVLAHYVHHVDGHHHGDADLGQLGGQVEVAFNVGAVYNVENGIRSLAYQIVARHHLLGGVGREGIDARQISHNDLTACGRRLGLCRGDQLALFFLYRDPWPVAHELVGSRQRVE